VVALEGVVRVLNPLMSGLLVITFAACASPTPAPGLTSPSATPQSKSTIAPQTLPPLPPPPTPQPKPTVAPLPQTPDVADIIFTDADIITMDQGIPLAQALAIRGDKILDVGSNAEMAKYRGAGTLLISLKGKILVPGFIDSHQYRIERRGEVGIADAGTIIQIAIQQGWTTLDELYVDQGVMDELRNLDQAGTLHLRINAYLPFMLYNAEGTKLGDWYQAYHQGQIISPHVRVAGLIGFADYDNATVLLWKQDDLTAFLLQAQRQGWSVALKTVSTHSLETILNAYEQVAAVDPKVLNSRGRLEHALFITADQIARIKQLGLVPIINLNNPGQLVGEQDVDAFIAREPQGSYTPWRNLERAGVLVANGTGWPSYYADEPTGAPFGSPMHLIYQAITRVGNLGKQPYPWLLDQTITADQAMRALTINSAYAALEENVKGSIKPGKLADLVVLSDNPLSVSPERINNIKVLMTMIGGHVEWCAPGSQALCPGAAPAPTHASTLAPTRAPAPASVPAPAVKNDPFTGNWSAIDPADGSRMTLQIARRGVAYHVVLVDEGATSCGLDAGGEPRFAAQVDATGTVNGNVLSTAVSSVKCLSDPPTSKQANLAIDYTYRSATDTLIDNSQGAVWARK
jgi:predicted amidohydrolase YtcJ